MGFIFNCVLIILGIFICILGICALQWTLLRLMNNLLPEPFSRAKGKCYPANKFNNSKESNNKNQNLCPSWQQQKGDYGNDDYDYDNSPVCFFASAWTHFYFLLDTTLRGIIKRYATKCKENLFMGKFTFACEEARVTSHSKRLHTHYDGLETSQGNEPWTFRLSKKYVR